MEQHKLLDLKNRIEKLSLDNQIQIFNILKNNNAEYTQNKNGVFVRLNKLDPSIIKDITDRVGRFTNLNSNKIVNI